MTLYPPELRSFKRGEVIYSPRSFEKKIGFLVSGCCEVRRAGPDATPVRINTLACGECFGVLAVFSEEAFPTEVVATKNSEVMFLDGSSVTSLVRSEGQVAMNIIGFLAGRVNFLNGRISTFSATTVEKKLASYILQTFEKQGSAELVFNCKRASEAISSGRASVYRALELLSEAGIISYENKKLILHDPEGLERISK